MSELIVGIDPGKAGGLCALDPIKGVIDLEVMPEDICAVEEMLGSWLLTFDSVFIFLEKAQCMPGNGIVSMFTYGVHFGELLACIKLMKIPYELVSANVWTKELHMGCGGDRSKERSRDACKRLFPNVSLSNPNRPRATRPHEGLMDALLIAEYGRRRRNSI